MENFIVSARKYRPSTFDTVVGQLSITTTLKNAIKNKHLAQAFLFCGPRGVGKTTCARILAKTINCEHITENTEPCNQCESCVSFNNARSLNIYELDAASNNSVEDIRNLTEQVRFPPHQGKYKIYIIDEVHMLSSSAFNAFLKTLEEPPSYAIFILATTEKHKIIPTILSRCQIFDFSRITIEDIASHLAVIAEKEQVKAENDALHIIAQKADGALRDALSIFDQLVSFAGNDITYKAVIENLNILDYDYYFSITDDILNGNISSVLLTFDEINNNGFDGHNFINGLNGHFRDLLVCRDEITIKLLEVSPVIKEKYKLQAQRCSPSFLFSVMDIANKCDVQYKLAKNQRLHTELALIKMCVPAFAEPENGININKTEQTQTSTPLPYPQNTKPAATTKAEEPKPVYKTQQTTSAGTPKTVSLSGIMDTPAAKPQEKIQETEETKKAAQTAAHPFSFDELLKVWNEYASFVKQQGKMGLFSSLAKRNPILKKNYLIEWTVDSTANLNTEKSNLVEYLRTRLNNFDIQLSIIVNKEKDEITVPYTTSEKFKKMSEKNPALLELKNRLDLTIDF